MSDINNKSAAGLQLWGFHWLTGHRWGDAHPDYVCHYDPGEVVVDGTTMRLGIGLKPRTINGEVFPWAVGLVRSAEYIKYGTLEVAFTLPWGAGLWPAIWCYDCNGWPPEIDLLEGWTGRQRFPLRRGPGYRRNLLLDYIFPSIHTADKHVVVSGGVLGYGVWPWYIDKHGRNVVQLEWTPSRIDVFLNGHRTLHITDDSSLAHFNTSQGMEIILNNTVQNEFSYDDYMHLYRRDLVIHSLNYKPM